MTAESTQPDISRESAVTQSMAYARRRCLEHVKHTMMSLHGTVVKVKLGGIRSSTQGSKDVMFRRNQLASLESV